MRKLSFLCFLCSAFLLTSCSEKQEGTKLSEEKEVAQSTTQEETKQSSGQLADTPQIVNCFTIDDFDERPPEKEYLPYGKETVKTEEGYGIYFRKADVQLTHVALNDTDNVLRIQYELPPFFSWGNWLSIKREFESLVDLNGCSGLALDLKVKVASNARLRITLSDVVAPEDAKKHGADEMWWFDFEPGVLNKTQGWVTLRAPLEDFYISWGEGTRHNNGQKDFSMIVAYEINLISKRDEHPKGVILVNSLRAYK